MMKTTLCAGTANGLLLLLIGALAGCALPGYSIKDYGEGSPWFGGNDARYNAQHPKSNVPDYKPVFKKIDAQLVLNLRQAPRQALGQAYTLPPKAAPTEYKIGRGDVLSVIVFGHPELTNPTGSTVPAGTGGSGVGRESSSGTGSLVDTHGNVYFPYAGSMHVAGMTVAQVRRTLTKRLARVLQQPQVDVRVVQFRSQRAYVVGDIRSPCVVPITDEPTSLLQVLTQCQSTSRGSSGGNQGQGIPAGLVKLQRNGKNYNIPLTALYLNPGRRVLVQNGDRIVIDNRFSRVFMVGEFGKQLAVPLSVGGLTLADAISAAGGLNLTTADPSAIYVIRGFVKKTSGPKAGVQTQIRPLVYKLNAGSADRLILADQFPLRPRDVVFAAPAGIVNFNRALAQLTPTLDLLFRSYLLYDRIGR